MSAGLTSHVLDISSGRPASGVKIELFRLQDGRGGAASYGSYKCGWASSGADVKRE